MRRTLVYRLKDVLGWAPALPSDTPLEAALRRIPAGLDGLYFYRTSYLKRRMRLSPGPINSRHHYHQRHFFIGAEKEGPKGGSNRKKSSSLVA